MVYAVPCIYLVPVYEGQTVNSCRLGGFACVITRSVAIAFRVVSRVFLPPFNPATPPGFQPVTSSRRGSLHVHTYTKNKRIGAGVLLVVCIQFHDLLGYFINATKKHMLRRSVIRATNKSFDTAVSWLTKSRRLFDFV